MKKDEKQPVRKKAQIVLNSLGRRSREAAAAAARTNLTAAPYWEEAESVLAYLAFGSELDADPVIQAALDEGKQVFVPKVKGSLMSFHRVKSLKTPFEKGVFGIREPLQTAEVWKLSSSPEPTLILVPGLAFDMKGARLGRGGGYYDRFLSGIRQKSLSTGKQAPLCIGFAYKELITEDVPVEKYDQRIDGLITDGFSGLF